MNAAIDTIGTTADETMEPQEKETFKEVKSMMLPIKRLRPFKDNPFRLYEGERLDDMVESIKEHGVLTPVIVRKKRNLIEILSGHNRVHAAELAGLTEIPAVVKTNLTDEEAYAYVIETNVFQRSFSDLLPSEKAAVMAAHYEKVCCQGKRNDIIRELQILSGEDPDATCCHNGKKLKSLDAVAAEYGFSSRNAARYLRLNHLIQPFKDLMDTKKLALLSAVDISYLSEAEQEMVWNMMESQGLKLKPAAAAKLHKAAGTLTEESVREIMDGPKVKREGSSVSLKLSKSICSKYFDGMNPEQMATVVEQALAAWFERTVD